MYGERAPNGKLFGDDIARLYRSGSQNQLEQYAERRRRIIGLQTNSDSLNSYQRKELAEFLLLETERDRSFQVGRNFCTAFPRLEPQGAYWKFLGRG